MGAERIILPGGMAVEVQDAPPGQQQIEAQTVLLGEIVKGLMTIGSQIDLLIQLECGYLPRAKMQQRFLAFEKQQQEEGGS